MNGDRKALLKERLDNINTAAKCGKTAFAIPCLVPILKEIIDEFGVNIFLSAHAHTQNLEPETVAIYTLCPAIKKDVILLLDGKDNGAVVEGQPSYCQAQTVCSHRNSPKCYLNRDYLKGRRKYAR